MKVIVYRGTDKIGGNCIEISSEKTRILLDFGYPLDWDKKLAKETTENLIKNDMLPNIKGIYDYDNLNFDAVFLSHYHLDHFGFLSRINRKIPIYASKICGQIICIYSELEICEKIPAKIKALKRFKGLKEVGDLKIEAFKMKHSAAGAYSFIITNKETDKRIFYSGDFSFNLNEISNSELISKINGIDAMIVEGTNIDSDKECLTEEEVYKKMKEEINNNNERLIIVSFSRSNISRWDTLLKVINETNRTLVLEPYGALILDFLAKELNINYKDKIRVFFESTMLTEKIKEKFQWFFKKIIPLKISAKKIKEKPNKYILVDSFYIRRYYEKYFNGLNEKPILIYSLWKGYFDDVQKRFWESKGIEIKHIHSSGHIYKKELIEFVNKVKPKIIIPVHTNNPQIFKDIFKDFNVMVLKNGESLEI